MGRPGVRALSAAGLRRALRRRGSTLASAFALLIASTTLVVLAVAADGYQSHDAQLNDGGIWVTSSSFGYFGRVNKPIGQLDGGLFAEQGASLDVVQDGPTVLGVNRSAGTLSPIDPGTVQHPEGEVAGIDGSADVAARGGTLAVAAPEDGSVWATVGDPELGPVTVSGLDRESQPLVRAGGSATMTVTQGGAVVTASADKDSMTVLPRQGGGLGDAVSTALPGGIGDLSRVTAVGEVPVVLDPEAGRLWALARGEESQPPRSDVPVDGVLQQAGPAAGEVLVSTPEALLSVPLEGGGPTVLAEGSGGRPAAPVRLGACQYAAWSGGGGRVVTVCDGQEPDSAPLRATTSDLVFRVNRDQILLNDRTTGAVWNIDSDKPTRLDDWEAFKRNVTESDDEEDQENEQQGDQRPPVANPDTLGARPGRTTVLHPLDNDTAPGGRLLAIRSVERVTGHRDASVTISPDGQTVQMTLPPGAAGRMSFVYHIDDGRQDKTAHATVKVPIRQEGQNGEPRLRPGFEPRSWTMPAGGVLDIPVLPDWRDRADGDPLAVTGAEAVGGQRSGAEARPTASGRVRVQAPGRGGPLQVRYTVSDGIGGDVERGLVVNVQDPKERQAFPGVAEPDVITGPVGEPIPISPLDNDQPGSDPLTPDARLSLAGRVPSPGDAETTTDLVDGTVTFTSGTAGTYFLDYDAAYGNAPLAKGTIRVDVRNPERPPDEPVAMPDTAMISGQRPVLVDVLRNDLDPAGGMLTVQRAEGQRDGQRDGQLDVAVVDGRWVRVAASQGQLASNPQIVRYEITNGSRSGIQGEIVVTQRDPERDVPVTEKDVVTVRAGAGVAIPVLDNDFSPSGGELTLVEDVAGEQAGRLAVRRPGDQQVPTGQAFVTGNFVRYVAPADLKDVNTFTITYLAANAEGVSSPGKVEVTVVPTDRTNQPPEPPTLEGRVVAGDSVTLRLPGVGVDPDGDAVTVLGIGSAPQLGRVVRSGATTVEYRSFPGSQGTDTFSYRVTDSFGGTATGTVRVAVAPPGVPQPPLAVDDPLTVEPGRTATIDLLANDHIASGDRVEATLVDPTEGARLESAIGPLEVRTPDRGAGRSVEVVYEVSNGLSSSRGKVTVRTASPYNNPPVAFDAFGRADDGAVVEVDVLKTAYDPDGPSEDLVVAEVLPPQGVEATVTDGTVRVARGPGPVVVPFRVEDADGGATTASLYVPPATDGLPYVVADSMIRLDPGEAIDADLGDHVEAPDGAPVRFTLKSRIWPSPLASVGAMVTGEDTFRVEAAEGYEGPGAVTFEVTTGSAVDDPDGVVAVLAVPVQVGDPGPVLRCPTEPVEIAQGSTQELDVASICHVWTPDSIDADDLSFTADWESSIDGLSIVEPEGSLIEVAASGAARPGVTARLLVDTEGAGAPGVIPVRVIDTPPPSLAPIRIADMKAGESRTIDLATYLRPGVPEPVPTLKTVTPETDLDVEAVKGGEDGPAELTLTTGERVSGTARFRIVMSDVADSISPDREVEGLIEVEVLDVPDTPTAPVPGRTVRSQEVHLSWRAPENNGAPIDYYEVRDHGGESIRCATTTCDVTGLVNGEDYRFQVRAVNAIGPSEWSDQSRVATPDAKPGQVGEIQMTGRGDGTISLRWSPPTTQTSDIEKYWVTWPGSSKGQSSTRPGIVIKGLDNHNAQKFTVVAENALDYGQPRTSAPFQSIGTPGTPPAPTVTDQQTGAGETAVTVSWNAVDPNGPTPVRYTVERNGQVVCANVEVTSCDDAGLAYDGTVYTYRVRATNNGGEEDAKTTPFGPGTQWSAVGRPAAWDESWTVDATGANTMAKVSFTVPPSRGKDSRVSILVDGAVRQTQQRTGAQTATVSVGDNDRPHAISLRVCNEKNNCSDSGTKSVQTYGPFSPNHIISSDPHVREIDTNQYEVWWTITVDSNGNPGRVRITSRSGDSDAIRNETYQMGNVNTQTFTTQKVRLDAYKSDIILIHLDDTSPRRAEVRKEDRHTTPERKQPKVTISKGSRCSDDPASSLPSCGGGSGANELCLDKSCGKIRFATVNYVDNRIRCFLYDSAAGQYGEKWIDSNKTYEPGPYYGYPGRQVWVTCNGIESNHYTWPSS